MAIWRTTEKIGTKIAPACQSDCTTVHLVPHWQSWVKNFPNFACTMRYLVAHWQRAFFHSQPELQYICWLNGIVEPKNVWKSDRCWEPQIPKFECYWQFWKLGKVRPKIALFPTQPVQWYIWWPNDKVGPKITLFPTQPILWYIWWPIQPVLWYIWWPTGKVGQKMHFSTVSLYYGTFGGPLAK